MRLQREDGVVAIEFAIVLPILLLILGGIVEFGFILYNKQVITNASREGARYGIVMATPKRSEAEIKSVVTTYMTNAGLAASADWVTAPAAGGPSGSDLMVQVDYPYTPWFFSSFIDLHLYADTTMRHE